MNSKLEPVRRETDLFFFEAETEDGESASLFVEADSTDNAIKLYRAAMYEYGWDVDEPIWCFKVGRKNRNRVVPWGVADGATGERVFVDKA